MNAFGDLLDAFVGMVVTLNVFLPARNYIGILFRAAVVVLAIFGFHVLRLSS